MSVRTYDPREPEIFEGARCSAGCGKPYYSICKFCNLAYCFDHLKKLPHACDTKGEYVVRTRAEMMEIQVEELERLQDSVICIKRVPIPENWDRSPKGCFSSHPGSGEICQLPVDGHIVHQRHHPNGVELECWINGNGAAS